MKPFLIVIVGGGLGACLRYALSVYISSYGAFPWATLSANILSCFILGVSMAMFKNEVISANTFLFLGMGLCGGFSTFSTFSMELFELFRIGRQIVALTYVLISTLCGLLAVYLGFVLSQNHWV